jgi:hypothetical protein
MGEPARIEFSDRAVDPTGAEVESMIVRRC